VLTNILKADVVKSFSFYQYNVDCTNKNDKNIESRGRRADLFRIGVWDTLMNDTPAREKEDFKRIVFFAGSYFFSARPIPGLEPSKLPLELVRGNATDGDRMSVVSVQHFGIPTLLQNANPVAGVQQMMERMQLEFELRCANCTRAFRNRNELVQHCQSLGHAPVYTPDSPPADGPARGEVFIAYVNLALQRAMGERLTRWGREFVDSNRPIPAVDRNNRDLGVNIYEAYSCNFNLICPLGGNSAQLALTCDLRAKIIRNKSVLDYLYESRRANTWTMPEQEKAKRDWIGQIIIYKTDRKCKCCI
jgi:hypothetical protein